MALRLLPCHVALFLFSCNRASRFEQTRLHLLAADGQVGIESMLAGIKEEFENTMRLMGVTSIAEIRAKGKTNTRPTLAAVFSNRTAQV